MGSKNKKNNSKNNHKSKNKKSKKKNNSIAPKKDNKELEAANNVWMCSRCRTKKFGYLI